MVTVTVLHEIARSGWWFISSATGVMPFTNSTEPVKSPHVEVLGDRLAVPRPAVERRPAGASISSSLEKCHRSPPVRIASLVPSSTEMLFALGLGDSVVAVTHECDYPPEAAERPHLTRSVIPEGLSAAEIDAAVRERTERGRGALRARRAAAGRARARPDRDPGGVRGVRGLLRRRARRGGAPALPAGGDLARPHDPRRGARRRAAAGRGGGRAEEAARRWWRRPAGASTPSAGRRGRRAPAGGGARVARPGVHRRALGAADDRARRRRRRARAAPGRSRARRSGRRWRRRSPRSSCRCRAATATEQAAEETLAARDAARAARRARGRRRRLVLLLAPGPAAGGRDRAARRTCCTPTACPSRPPGASPA